MLALVAVCLIAAVIGGTFLMIRREQKKRERIARRRARRNRVERDWWAAGLVSRFRRPKQIADQSHRRIDIVDR